MVFQSFNLFPHLTILENVTLAPRHVRRKARKEAEERAMQLLERALHPTVNKALGSRRVPVSQTGSQASDPTGTPLDATGHPMLISGRTALDRTQQDTLDATCKRMVAGSIPAPGSGFAPFRAGCGGRPAPGSQSGSLDPRAHREPARARPQARDHPFSTALRALTVTATHELLALDL